ncbi:MAG: hypothetical protein AB1351_02985 [Thermoproteota archaeon]
MKASVIMVAVVAAGLMAASTNAAFGHAHMTLAPDIENVNPISVTVGHSNEPTYGAKPGIHDGKHGVEVLIEDDRTALPLTGAQLKIDKYYFKDMRAFERASSPNDATEVQLNVTLDAIFGNPGHYRSRQVMADGIYGYRIYGTIDYFGVAQVPIDTTVFCNAGMQGNTSKFNSEGWSGSYGCTEKIENTLFPKGNSAVMRTDYSGNKSEIQQAAASEPMFQILSLAGVSGTAVAAFFGTRRFRKSRA